MGLSLAFILVSGIAVDNASVIGKNVHTHERRVLDPMTSSPCPAVNASLVLLHYLSARRADGTPQPVLRHAPGCNASTL